MNGRVSCWGSHRKGSGAVGQIQRMLEVERLLAVAGEGARQRDTGKQEKNTKNYVRNAHQF